jgi:hypothetical protein
MNFGPKRVKSSLKEIGLKRLRTLLIMSNRPAILLSTGWQALTLKHNFSWEAGSHSGGQKLSCLQCNPKVHYLVPNSGPLVPIPSQTNRHHPFIISVSNPHLDLSKRFRRLMFGKQSSLPRRPSYPHLVFVSVPTHITENYPEPVPSLICFPYIYTSQSLKWQVS